MLCVSAVHGPRFPREISLPAAASIFRLPRIIASRAWYQSIASESLSHDGQTSLFVRCVKNDAPQSLHVFFRNVVLLLRFIASLCTFFLQLAQYIAIPPETGLPHIMHLPDGLFRARQRFTRSAVVFPVPGCACFTLHSSQNFSVHRICKNGFPQSAQNTSCGEYFSLDIN